MQWILVVLAGAVLLMGLIFFGARLFRPRKEGETDKTDENSEGSSEDG